MVIVRIPGAPSVAEKTMIRDSIFSKFAPVKTADMEAIMFFEQAIAHQIPGYTKEADSLHGESLAMLDYKDELKVKNDAL